MKIDREAPVGVFDSGVGGLTVAREIMRNLPSEKIVYFGDTARVPYGSKSRETIIRYSRQIIRFLQEQQVTSVMAKVLRSNSRSLHFHLKLGYRQISNDDEYDYLIKDLNK